MHAKPRWGSMPLSGLLPRIPAKASKYASRTAPPVFLSAFGTRCSIRSSAMENLTARGWALLLSARSYKTILVLCPSSRLRNAEPPFSYDCLFHINPPPTVWNPYSLEHHSGIDGEWFKPFSSRILPFEPLRMRIGSCVRMRVVLSVLVLVSRGEIGIFRDADCAKILCHR